jgi:ferritin
MLLTSLLKPEIKGLFNKACEAELKASHLYQYLANQMQRLGFFGVQKYFLHESMEERSHYQKLADYINDMGDSAVIPPIESIANKIGSIGDALNLSFITEKDLMYKYQEFYEKAEDSGDCITSTFLIEFLQIQRKSVGEFGDLIVRYNANQNDVFEFDEYMGDLIK